ncbi:MULTISPECIES: DUF5068 domain-containing protein [Paenibacillus]|uniref:DUF5068 domain-containing protein n=1 Tax=Paenibacillus TaxID=44249 RepID=UPI0022B8E7A7|nr:DUF5068 domain-containing protein [Paenibacillus caseinilyticus]MCZ8520908.1 DUF5068 domain-containing protein [Paenibacillus caseinilyticus]
MMKKQVVSSILLSAVLLLTACGANQQAEAPAPAQELAKNAAATPAAEPKKETAAASTKKPEAASSSGGSGGSPLNPNIAVESEGNVEVIYTNQAPGYTHNMDGFKVTVEEYQIVKVTDMNKRVASIPFENQTEGYVVTAKVTLDNGSGKAMYYNNNYRIQVSKSSDYVPNDSNRTFIRKEDQLKSKQETEASKFASGEKITGLISFTLTHEEFASLKSVKPKFIIEGGASDNDQFKGSFKGDATFDFTYSEEQKQQAASEPKFYPDRLTTDNLADKKMIFEKTGIGETKQIGDVKITLDGVQYTEVIPTAANQARFKTFGENGIVAVTVKLLIDNPSDTALSLFSTGSKLHVDGNRGTALSQGLVEPRDPDEVKPGGGATKYHVFLFRKDEFGLYKAFGLEFGPFTGTDGKRLFKEATAEFTLPR